MANFVNYKFDPSSDKSPSEQVEVFLSGLSNKYLEFYPPSNFDFDKAINEIEKSGDHQVSKKYPVKEVSMNGDCSYVQNKLDELQPLFEKYIDDYTDSEESISNKLFELSNSRLHIRRFLYRSDLGQPALYKSPNLIKLFKNFNEETYILVNMLQCELDETAKEQIEEHHTIRHAHLKLLLEFLDIQIEKIRTQEYANLLMPKEPSTPHEMLLMDIWIGLDNMNFLAGMIDAKKAEQRRKFFQLFGYTEKNFRSRKKKDISKRNNPREKNLDELITHFKKATA